MRDIKEIFRLRFNLNLSQRKVAKATGFGRTTVQEYELKAIEAGLTSMEQIEGLTPNDLYTKLGFKQSQFTKTNSTESSNEKIIPDWTVIREELSQKHMTLSLLWTEYKEQHPKRSYQYSQFCYLYQQWSKKLSLVMRQEHKAGEKIFVDYAGTTFKVLDRGTGEIHSAQVFVGVLGASSYVFAEATWTQGLPDWLASHRRMLEFFGGVSEIIIPDNLKSGITSPDRYEAKVNDSYREFAEHYGTCIIPARVRKPKDKAKVEVSVQVITRWITMALRKRTFYSLEELNQVIREYLDRVNQKKMRHLGKSRKELFEQLDKPALKPLSAKPYEYGEWKKVRANVDYHVAFEKSFYSVPYQLVGHELWVRASSEHIEIYENILRICSHRRTHLEGKYVTDASHRPKAHDEQSKWTPERLIQWGRSKGNFVAQFIEALIENRGEHKEQAYRSVLGCLRLSDKYGGARLDRACEIALNLESYKYQTIKNILSNNMDKIQGGDQNNINLNEQFTGPDNVRGSEFYH